MGDERSEAAPWCWDPPVSDLTGFWPAAGRLVLPADAHLDHEPLLEATVAACLSSADNSATVGRDHR